MTNENKQALEWLRKHVGKDYLNNKQREEIEKSHKMLNVLEAALQPQPSVDVEGLKKNTVSALLKKEVEHVKAKALQQNFSFNKAQGELEYFTKRVIDHLNSQGHLNQGWQRGKGQTTEAVRIAKETGAYLIVRDKNTAIRISQQERDLRFPVTFNELIVSRMKGSAIKNIVIDDVEDLKNILLNSLTAGFDVTLPQPPKKRG